MSTTTTTTDWRDELIASTPGLQDPKAVRYVLLGVEDREWAAELVRRWVPTFPEPVAAEVPAWATQADKWRWVTVDDVWQRTVSRPFRWAEGGGFDVVATQEASADETVTTPRPEIMVDLADDTINNAADGR